MPHNIDRWREVDALFEQALDLAPADRAALLDERCAGDLPLRNEVEALLRASEAALTGRGSAFLAAPPDVAALVGDGTAAPDPALLERIAAAPSPGEEWIGPYRLLRQIGHGGMGTVFLAERADGQFTQRVAVKRIRAGLETGAARERFLQERQILARLEHPNVTRLSDGGLTREGAPYLVMEYVEGAPIDRYCDERRLSVEERLALFLQVCEAVQYAHQNLVVHRDLKPSNILVTGAGQVKLLDFGIAKLLDEAERSASPATLTSLGGPLLTPDYAAPEQVRGEAITTATDVYALGAVLYELLTGRRPHRLTGRGAVELERVICREDPLAPSAAVRQTGAPESIDAATPAATALARSTDPERLRRRLADDLDAVVLTALRKEPARRYHTVEQLAEDLRRHLAGQPVSARKETLAYVAAKFARRHRGAVAAAAMLLLTLLGGITATAYQAHEARRQAEAAQREARKAERINLFLQEMLSSVDPANGGRDVTVAEVLAAAAEDVGTELQEEPEVEAAVRTTIGSVYRSLGLFDLAETQLEQALDLRKRTLEPGHPDLSRSMSLLGDHYSQVGRHAEAEPLLRDAFTMQQAHLGSEHPDVAKTQVNLGTLLQSQGRFEEAEALYQAALRTQKRTLGPFGREVASTLNNLAVLHFEIGDYAAAESLLKQVIEVKRTAYGPRHISMTNNMGSLAALLSESGRHRESEAMLREALSIQREAFGAEHPNIALSLANLAAARQSQGDFAEAGHLFREALAMERKLRGPVHMDVGLTTASLGWLYLEAGDYPQAERTLQEALSVLRASVGEGHSLTAKSLIGLGTLMTETGRPAQAEPLLREAVEIRTKVFARDNYRTAAALSALGGALTVLGRYEEAEGLLLESHAALKGKSGHALAEYRRTVTRLNALYEATGRPEKAAELIDPTVPGSK